MTFLFETIFESLFRKVYIMQYVICTLILQIIRQTIKLLISYLVNLQLSKRTLMSNRLDLISIIFITAALQVSFAFQLQHASITPDNDDSLLFNCSAIFLFQRTRIADLIESAYHNFTNNYADQASFIKNGLQDHLGGGTWEVIITSNVSAKSLDEISKNVLGHYPFNPQGLCVFWYGVNAKDTLVMYLVEKMSVIGFPESQTSTRDPQHYSPYFSDKNVFDMKNAAKAVCSSVKTLEDFSSSFAEELSKIIPNKSPTSWRVFSSTTEYNGLAPATYGSIFVYWFWGAMPKFCQVNGKLINIMFWGH